MPPAKRKAPPFKPPRPVSKPSTSPVTKSKPTKTNTKSKTTQRRSSTRPTSPLSSDEGEEEAEEQDEEEGEDDAPPSPAAAPVDPPSLAIPSKLLTRLLHHHFTDENTSIAKEAKELAGKYMETFVREALARAAFEKGERVGAGGDFLEVSRHLLQLWLWVYRGAREYSRGVLMDGINCLRTNRLVGLREIADSE